MELTAHEYSFKSASGLCDIFAQSAVPADFANVKGVVQIAHGMAEHSNRYAAFAKALAENGYAVFINDHLGHGKSVASKDDLGYFGEGGYDNLVKDMKQLTEIAKKEYPDLPYFIFGHSMGSFLAREYAARYGHQIDGAIFCGTAGPNPAASIGITLAKHFEKSKGDHVRSGFLNSMAFGSYNKRTEKRTEFDWLTKDTAVVDKYIADELCGYCFTANGFEGLFSVLKQVSSKLWFNTVPKELPILLIAGAEDPVGAYGKGVKQVFDQLKETGHSNVLMKLYANDRHEILNETDKEQVMADIIEWIDKTAVK